MAKKTNLLKLLQEVRGYNQLTHRRPAPPTPLLYLMQLRQRNANAQSSVPQPAPRLAITAEWPKPAEGSLPVKINHSISAEYDVVIG